MQIKVKVGEQFGGTGITPPSGICKSLNGYAWGSAAQTLDYGSDVTAIPLFYGRFTAMYTIQFVQIC